MFNPSRRDLLIGAPLLAAGLPALGAAVAQEAYPARNVTFICAFPPGSGSDTLVRYFADKIRPLMGRQVLVENRFGAGGNIAAEHTARSKPDGYTIFVHAASAIAGNMYLYKNPPIDAGKALTVAASVNRQPFMVVVDASKPWKNVAELTAFLKEKGDKATYATSATAGTIMGEMYKVATGTQAVEVVYRVGADSLNDQLGGKIDYGMFDPVYTMSQVRAGRLRALAVSTGRRLDAVPDIPTMQEEGFKDFDLTTWFSAMVPAGTPKPVIAQINAWFREVLATEETRKFLNSFGGDPFISTPEEAQAMFEKDLRSWADYVRIAKIQPQ
ncbi:MAG: hypothetical protein JWN93_2977 [Hyphomicrobiales bacterium]|nr:hypothetical protein [Hyphomicrobiales bacterium]